MVQKTLSQIIERMKKDSGHVVLEKIPVYVRIEDAAEAIKAILYPGTVVLERVIFEEGLVSVRQDELEQALKAVRDPGDVKIGKLKIIHVNLIKK